MFACYTVIGVGHDTVHLTRHAHGLLNNNLSTMNEEEGSIEMEELDYLSGVTPNDKEVNEQDEVEVEDGDEDEASDASNDSRSDFDDSDSDTHL